MASTHRLVYGNPQSSQARESCQTQEQAREGMTPTMEKNRAAAKEASGALPSRPDVVPPGEDQARETALEDGEEAGYSLGDILKMERESESESEEEGLMMKKYSRPVPVKPVPFAAPPSRSSAASNGSTSTAVDQTALTESALSQLPYEPFTIIQRFLNPEQPWKVVIPKWWLKTVVVGEKWSEKKAVTDNG